MKTIYAIFFWLGMLVYMLCAQITNGGFTDGILGWSGTGSVSVQTYTTGALASFNGSPTMDTPNDGVLSQTIPTVAGLRYTVSFDMGLTGSALGEQKLDLNGRVFSMTKDQPGTQWGKRTFDFTALSPATALVFSDASTTTNGIDLLLDDVTVTAVAADGGVPPPVVLPPPPVVPPVPPIVLPPPPVSPARTTAPCKITWDPQPGCNYRVYVGGAPRDTVVTNSATVTLADDQLSSLSVSAVSLAGIEGPTSAVLVVQPVKSWESADLGLTHWNKVAVGFVEFNPVRRYYRISYPLPSSPNP